MSKPGFDDYRPGRAERRNDYDDGIAIFWLGVVLAFLFGALVVGISWREKTDRLNHLRDSLADAKPVVIRDTVTIHQVVVYSPQDSTLRVLKERKR